MNLAHHADTIHAQTPAAPFTIAQALALFGLFLLFAVVLLRAVKPRHDNHPRMAHQTRRR